MSIITVNSGASRQTQMVKCDSCDARVPEEDFRQSKAIGWKFGMRGYVMAPMVCAAQFEQNHACANELCQARLLVWARS